MALRLGFGPQDWDLGLETGIWDSGLEFEGGGRNRRRRRRRRRRKSPICVKAYVIDPFGAAAQKDSCHGPKGGQSKRTNNQKSNLLTKHCLSIAFHLKFTKKNMHLPTPFACFITAVR